MNEEFEEWIKDVDNYPTMETYLNTYIRNDIFCEKIKNNIWKVLNEIQKEAFEAGQKAEIDKNKWIPIEESYPEEGKSVLIKYIFNNEEKICVGYYITYEPTEDEIGHGETLFQPHFEDEDDHYTELSDYEIIEWKSL